MALVDSAGAVAEDEMWRVFNCGIGMALIVAPAHAGAAADHLRQSGETVYAIGTVEQSEGEPQALIV